MKIKFILHGGFDKSKIDEDNSAFYSEVLKDAPENARVLLVPFAKDTERIPVAAERVSAEFNKYKWQKDITINIATEKNLIEEINSADIVDFQGGVSLKLLEALRNYPNLKESLGGKIVAGESAGANVLCEFFYSPRSDTVSEGLGMVPVKIVPHYKEEYKNKLDEVGPDLETVLLPEYEYRVFTID